VVTRREVVIDRRLGANWAAQYATRERIAAERDHLRRALRATKRENVEEAAHALVADPDAAPWKRSEVERSLERLATARADLARLQAEAAPDEAAYDRAPWPRFFLVEHIHKSQWCHTLRPTTKIGWLPDLSGLTEAEAVAAHGAILCTHCFPSAPVEWTNGHEVAAAAKKASQCPGSGTWDYDRERDADSLRCYYGRGAHCQHCGEFTSVTSTGKLRAHKAKGGRL
jgi:hypothetical protein